MARACSGRSLTLCSALRAHSFGLTRIGIVYQSKLAPVRTSATIEQPNRLGVGGDDPNADSANHNPEYEQAAQQNAVSGYRTVDTSEMDKLTTVRS
jgi:hypothetical protein